METVQYIVTVELWSEGGCVGWDQFAIGLWAPAFAQELLEKIRTTALGGRDKEVYAVKITDIIKL